MFWRPVPVVLAAVAVLAGAAGCASGGPEPAATPKPSEGAATSGPSQRAAAPDCTKAGPRDFDGDGRDDVAVGNRMLSGGQVSLLTAGRLVPLTIQDEAADAVGSSVALTRVDADGCADLVVGAPYTKVDGKGGAGAVYVLYGGGTRPHRKLVAPEPQENARFGSSVAAYGGTIAVGAPLEEERGARAAGAVYVFPEGADARRISQETEGVPGNSEMGDRFGHSLALGPLPDGRLRLLVGAPDERKDGTGQQLGRGGAGHAGSVTLIDEVRAERYQALKFDGASEECAYGAAVAHLPGDRWAVTAPRCGTLQVNGTSGPVRTVSCQACAGSLSALAVSPDGRLAVAWGDSAVVLVPDDEEGVRDQVVPTLPGGNWPVAFYGSKLVFGRPRDTPPLTVTVHDPATGTAEEVAIEGGTGDVEGVGEALG
ncbi:hypothetical protein [Nonomuraea sp. NPDC049504]|uniref:hypothetical protein n=1 Tax=Nonomuraea sp. NPDC049504 TaxID=3154729 RepID=UPI003432FF9A